MQYNSNAATVVYVPFRDFREEEEGGGGGRVVEEEEEEEEGGGGVRAGK